MQSQSVKGEEETKEQANVGEEKKAGIVDIELMDKIFKKSKVPIKDDLEQHMPFQMLKAFPVTGIILSFYGDRK